MFWVYESSKIMVAHHNFPNQFPEARGDDDRPPATGVPLNIPLNDERSGEPSPI